MELNYTQPIKGRPLCLQLQSGPENACVLISVGEVVDSISAGWCQLCTQSLVTVDSLPKVVQTLQNLLCENLNPSCLENGEQLCIWDINCTRTENRFSIQLSLYRMLFFTRCPLNGKHIDFLQTSSGLFCQNS